VTNSRSKGKRGELEFRDLLRSHGYTEARRGQQFAGGPDSPDVVGGPPGIHFEVKNRERHDVWAAMEQADAERKDDYRPVVAIKRNHKPWLIVLTQEHFFDLIRDAQTITEEP
jgi:Holliday junction resolvase